jgi:uncharacterized lipoprotein YehR (DUF1307 family)
MKSIRALILLLILAMALTACDKKQSDALYHESGKGVEAPVKSVPKDLLPPSRPSPTWPAP